MLEWVSVRVCSYCIGLLGMCLMNIPSFTMGDKTMEKEKKAKAPSKKELMREIENLDTNKVFDLVSLSRTNIANIIAIRELLKG